MRKLLTILLLVFSFSASATPSYLRPAEHFSWYNEHAINKVMAPARPLLIISPVKPKLIPKGFKVLAYFFPQSGRIIEVSNYGMALDMPKPVCSGIRRYPGRGSDGGYFADGLTTIWNPGDTIVIRASDDHRTYFAIQNFHGTATCPIVIINEGGPADVEAISLTNCTYFHITGTGDPETQYGLYLAKVEGKGQAFNIGGRSSDIEVDHFEVFGQSYIAWMKQDPSCVDSTWNYPNWVNRNSSIHDFYAHNIGQDGIYWDNTSSNGSTDFCGGSTVIYPQHSFKGKIYNGIIDSLNRTGAQMSACDSCEIYNLTIRNAGFEYNQSQGAGIALGSQASNCYVHDNNIKKTFGPALFMLARGNHRFYNNIGDSTGMLSIDPYVNMDSLVLALDQKIAWGPDGIDQPPGTPGSDDNDTWMTGNFHFRYSGHILYNTFSQPSGFTADPTRDALSDPTILPYLQHPYDSSSFSLVNNQFGEAITLDASRNITHNVNANRIRIIDDGVSNKYGHFNFQCQNVILEDRLTPVVVSNVNGVNIINSCPPSAPGAPPSANAGVDQYAFVGTSALLIGSGTPASGLSITSYHWDAISGPNNPTINSPDALSTTVSGLVVGVYQFRLTVTQSDSQTGSDDLTVTVVVLPARFILSGSIIRNGVRLGKAKKKTF
jgi:hypothetical protein